MVLENAEIYLVSEMEEDLVRTAFLTPKASAQQALEDAFKKLGPNATVLAMPYGGSTLPKLKEE
jgi:nickel-dependent lactate racemase